MSKNNLLAKPDNPHPFSVETTRRHIGGQKHAPPEAQEVHDSVKGSKIPEDRRYAGAGAATLENSPGRASSDVSEGGK